MRKSKVKVTTFHYALLFLAFTGFIQYTHGVNVRSVVASALPSRSGTTFTKISHVSRARGHHLKPTRTTHISSNSYKSEEDNECHSPAWCELVNKGMASKLMYVMMSLASAIKVMNCLHLFRISLEISSPSTTSSLRGHTTDSFGQRMKEKKCAMRELFSDHEKTDVGRCLSSQWPRLNADDEAESPLKLSQILVVFTNFHPLSMYCTYVHPIRRKKETRIEFIDPPSSSSSEFKGNGSQFPCLCQNCRPPNWQQLFVSCRNRGQAKSKHETEIGTSWLPFRRSRRPGHDLWPAQVWWWRRQ